MTTRTTHTPVAVKYTVTRHFGAAEIEDLFVTAIESGPYGSLWWDTTPEMTTSDNPVAVDIARHVLRGGVVHVEDRYGDGFTGTVDLESLRSALSHRLAAGFDPENYDVTDADAVMQLAALGEVIYG